jgi:L-gulonate 3-dehydrogenase
VNHVAIVGSGLIGRGWAIVFARAGWAVRLTDPHGPTLAAAPALIRAELDALARHDLVDDPALAAARLHVAANLADAVADVDLVQENGPEDADAKRAIYAELDVLTRPDTILASSTSAIVASRFTEGLKGRGRCLVAHPVNPPHLVPVVELCGAPWTDPAVIARAGSIYACVGQAPILVKREVDGFILNRLQGALLAEAFRLVGEGLVSPQDLDTTLKDGLGLRWSFIGPFATIELNAPGGIADYCQRYTGFYKRLADDPAKPSVYDDDNVARIVAQWPHAAGEARIAARTRWRNERLAALVAHKRGQGEAPE